MSKGRRINGGRFYQQTRKVRGKEYGPYWFCRSGWGKVTHLGAHIPAPVEQAFDTIDRATTLLNDLEQIAILLKRFTKGDALTGPELDRLAALGFTLPVDVLEISQRADVVSRCEPGVAQHLRNRLNELTTDQKERDALIRLGLICATPAHQRNTTEKEAA